jgi:hypothetical protein
MAITTRPPQTPVAPRAIVDRPRRWPKRVLVALVAAVLVVVLGAFVWLDRYQPLATGSGSYSVWPKAATVASFDASGWDEGTFTQTYARWKVGRTFHMQFPLWNDGPVPVAIDGVTGDQVDRTGPISVRIVGVGPIQGPQAGHMVQALSPFTLGPNEGIQLFVDVTMQKPVDPATGAIVNTIQLSYSTWWMHHTITMPMGQTLYLCGGACPP